MESAKDPNVAGFKSVVCYRTGLDVSAVDDSRAASTALMSIYLKYRQSNVPLRLADKPVNDFVVRMALEVAAEHNKPGMDPAFSLFSFLGLNMKFTFYTLYLLQYSSIQVLATQISRWRVRARPTCSL